MIGNRQAVERGERTFRRGESDLERISAEHATAASWEGDYETNDSKNPAEVAILSASKRSEALTVANRIDPSIEQIELQAKQKHTNYHAYEDSNNIYLDCAQSERDASIDACKVGGEMSERENQVFMAKRQNEGVPNAPSNKNMEPMQVIMRFAEPL